jgi:two-component system sensor histidine kinase BarA
VADDNAVNREVIAEVLRQLDVTFDLVEDGSRALTQWRADHYDLVLMDCSMPVMDGLEATRQLRREEGDSGRSRTPVIALTALIEGGNNAGSWHEAGMDALITKPFAIAQIAEAIQKLTVEAALQASQAASHLQSSAGQDSKIHCDNPAIDTVAVQVLDESVLRDLLDIGAGDPKFVRRMFDLFEENADPALERLTQAAGNPDLIQLADAAHALKSMASNLGARRLVSACEAVETAARNDEQFDVSQSLQLISDEITAARSALDQRINAA